MAADAQWRTLTSHRSCCCSDPMGRDHIPIEADPDGLGGVVKQEGGEGSMPDLVAYRPEPWRFLRLARVVGVAKYIAANELGLEEATAMINAMVQISDYKGTLGVVWRGTSHNSAFESVLSRAWASEGEVEGGDLGEIFHADAASEGAIE
ncbi:hypothetical protein FHS96_005582 [Sphingomonas zeicaulis]|uniref:hypothetical protein n=1 Tax=Sphingomonas zeicaulis TaxID=1632740 RepID=UPI003D1B3C3D